MFVHLLLLAANVNLVATENTINPENQIAENQIAENQIAENQIVVANSFISLLNNLGNLFV
jgi:hypothetical protein